MILTNNILDFRFLTQFGPPLVCPFVDREIRGQSSNFTPLCFWQRTVVLRRLRDPDSAVRAACVEAVSSIAAQITKPPFSSIVKPFVDSIFHEQDHNSQIGASLCLAAAIEATPDPDPAELRKLLPKLYKLVKNDCFKAKPSLLSLIGSIVSVGGAANRTVLNGLVSTLVDSTRAAMAMATIERTRPVPILCK